MKKVILSAVAVAAIILVSNFLFKTTSQAPVSQQTVLQQGTQQQSQGQTTPILTQQQEETQKTTEVGNESNITQNEVKNEVIYNNNSYSPGSLTVKVGETVNWKNESSGGMWTASAMHPSHAIYAGTTLQEHCPDNTNTSFDECKSSQPGESWSFTFIKAGTWRYHNHVQPSHFGSIIVE